MEDSIVCDVLLVKFSRKGTKRKNDAYIKGGLKKVLELGFSRELTITERDLKSISFQIFLSLVLLCFCTGRGVWCQRSILGITNYYYIIELIT